MQCFEHQGKKYIGINGKDYFLLHGYRVNYSKYIFVQVSGKTPLNKEDLPSKAWEVFCTKAGGQRVWTAYVKNYFAYESAKESGKLAFLGATTSGSYFLALRFMCRLKQLKMEEKELSLIARQYAMGERSHYRLEVCADLGSSETDLILADFSGCFNTDFHEALNHHNYTQGRVLGGVA
jgi:hypothetical protein